MESSFFSMIFRMKYIHRWGLMRNTRYESLSEHSMEVAMIAHALGVIENKRFGGRTNPERLAVLGLFHDANEIITGDLPTPIKYHDEEIKTAYKRVEQAASTRLLGYLPDDLRADYAPLFEVREEERALLKAADKIAALIKCIDEERAGNLEFVRAKSAQQAAIEQMALPAAQVFLDTFVGAFYKTLDEQD